MTNKLIRDSLGSPIPQHLDEGSGFYVANTNGTGDASSVDFTKKKLLRDALGSVIPQYYDVVEGKFKPITSDGSSGSSGPTSWDDVTGKPIEFNPTAHGHKISDVEGLDERLTEVFTQVSDGKMLLETTIIEKGGKVEKIGSFPTFEEIRVGFLSIEHPEVLETLYGATNFTDLKNHYSGSFTVGINFAAGKNMLIHGVTLIVPKIGRTKVGIAMADNVEVESVVETVNVIGEHYDIFFSEPIKLDQGETCTIYYETDIVGFYAFSNDSFNFNTSINSTKKVYGSIGTVPILGATGYRGVFPIFSLIK